MERTPKSETNNSQSTDLVRRRHKRHRNVSHKKMNTSDKRIFCHMEQLPPELINHIFSYLKLEERLRMESVCKRWKQINRHDPWITIPESIILGRGWISRIDTIPSIYISRIRSIKVPGGAPFNVIAKHYCPNIVALSCYDIREPVKDLTDCCQRLKTLKIKDSSITDDDFESILKTTKLEYVRLDNVTGLRGHSLQYLPPGLQKLVLTSVFDLYKLEPVHCKSIKHLRVYSCLYYLSEENLLQIVRRCAKSLTTLTLEKYSGRHHTGKLSTAIGECSNLMEIHLSLPFGDDFIRMISESCANVRKLSISRMELITDVSFELVTRMKELTTLKFDYCPNLTNAGLRHVAELAHLKELEIHFCKDKEIYDAGIYLMKNCTNLEKLVFGTTDKFPTVLESEAKKLGFDSFRLLLGYVFLKEKKEKSNHFC